MVNNVLLTSSLSRLSINADTARGHYQCLGMGMVCLLVLAGCQKLEEFSSQKNRAISTDERAASVDNPAHQHTSNGRPVVYPIDTWRQQSVAKPISLWDSNTLSAQLGEPSSVDARQLDYDSNLATKYSFAKTGAPYFDVLDSTKYMEIQWYFAGSHDSDAIKQMSVQHAKNAFELAQQWLGEEGATVVAAMLDGQTLQNKTYQGTLIALARCQNYHCDLVIKKPKRPTKKVSS